MAQKTVEIRVLYTCCVRLLLPRGRLQNRLAIHLRRYRVDLWAGSVRLDERKHRMVRES